jgi:hypothetical protein
MTEDGINDDLADVPAASLDRLQIASSETATIRRYPFGSLVVGHSCYVQCVTPEDFTRAQVAAHACARRHGWKMRTARDASGLLATRLA